MEQSAQIQEEFDRARSLHSALKEKACKYIPELVANAMAQIQDMQN